jgi:membrane-associated phospholipid phosphatase
MKSNKLLSILDKYDKHLSYYIHMSEFSEYIEVSVYCLARMFNPDLITCYFIIMALTSFSNFYFVFKPIIHTLISLIITTILKKTIARPRPEKFDRKRLFDLRQHEKNYSMPSGDSFQAANFAIILYVYYNTWLGFMLVPLVMYARIFYFCHYILDTIVGSSMGFLISYITYLLIN